MLARNAAARSAERKRAQRQSTLEDRRERFDNETTVLYLFGNSFAHFRLRALLEHENSQFILEVANSVETETDRQVRLNMNEMIKSFSYCSQYTGSDARAGQGAARDTRAGPTGHCRAKALRPMDAKQRRAAHTEVQTGAPGALPSWTGLA